MNRIQTAADAPVAPSARSLTPRNIFWLITKPTVAMGSTINGAQRLS